MKECPVCNESFPNELKFCDIDGTRLTRTIDAGESRGSGRVWSLLGAGLLVAGLVVTGAAIVFFPKTRSGPAQPVQTRNENPVSPAKPNESSPKEPAAEVAINSQPGGAKPVISPTAPQDSSTVQAKKRDGAAAVSGSAAAATPNAKSAAKGGDDSEKAAAKNVTREAADPKTTVDSTETVAAKPANPAPAGDSNAKADQTAADPKRDAKRASSKNGDKEPNANKKDEKKGGLLRVFKKIFGKS